MNPEPPYQMSLGDQWVSIAQRKLLNLRAPEIGWGYRRDGEPSVEPSALACLGLLATLQRDHLKAEPAVRETADWLASLQQTDGSLGVTARLSAPKWPTPLAILLWRTLGVCPENRTRATQWLLRIEGDSPPRDPDHPAAHDTSIPGWPWVSGTHSWLEPTVMAVLALRGERAKSAARIRDGLRLIRDRTIPSGGWNYGNPGAFGTALRPQPASTGLALMALSNREPDTSPIVRRACDYLETTLPLTRSPQSLCWGLWGLAAWGRRPVSGDMWLAQAWQQTEHRPDLVLQLAYLLMGTANPLPSIVPTTG